MGCLRDEYIKASRKQKDLAKKRSQTASSTSSKKPKGESKMFPNLPAKPQTQDRMRKIMKYEENNADLLTFWAKT